MTTSRQEAYFTWLVSQIENEKDRWEYNDLYRLMHATEFVWIVPNDDNRILDGLEIRSTWEALNGDVGGFPCSVLEVLLGLSRRLEFTVGGTSRGWAWQLVLNLGCERLYDPLGVHKAERALEIFHNLVWRTYAPDGTGGFFPLQDPDEDQTQIEIWYQMAAYIGEILPD